MIHSCFVGSRGLGAINTAVGLFLRCHHNAATRSTWEKPSMGWVKLNFDGASKYATRNASIGGVYRDHEGLFLLGYAESIGKATSSVAELAAAKRGIELALKNGWSNVWIEGDAKVVVDVLVNGMRSKSEEDLRLMKDISMMIPLLNDFSTSHIYREGNKVADKLAKMGYKTRKLRIWRDVPPHELSRLLRQDAEGKTILRKK